MNPIELRAYKRDKSKKFNAHLRDLRLKEKKRIADQQPDNQEDNLQRNQEDNLQRNQEDNLSLQDLMDIYETLENKLDLIDNKLETIMENKLYETLDTKMDIIQNKLETIMENKLENKLEPNTLLPQFKPIFFA